MKIIDGELHVTRKEHSELTKAVAEADYDGGAKLGELLGEPMLRAVQEKNMMGQTVKVVVDR